MTAEIKRQIARVKNNKAQPRSTPPMRATGLDTIHKSTFDDGPSHCGEARQATAAAGFAAAPRTELCKEIQQHLAFNKLFQATSVLVHPKAFGVAFRKLPANPNTALPEDPQEVKELFADKDVLHYILSWSKMCAVKGAYRARIDVTGPFVDQSVFKVYAFLTNQTWAKGKPMSRAPLQSYIADGRITSFRELADKISLMAGCGPYRNWQTERRESGKIAFCPPEIIEDIADDERATPEALFKECFATRVFLWMLADSVRHAFEKLKSGRLKEEAAQKEARKIASLRGEIVYQRSKLLRHPQKRDAIATRFDADVITMSRSRDYAVKKLRDLKSLSVGTLVHSAGFDVSHLARAHGLTDHAIINLTSGDFDPA